MNAREVVLQILITAITVTVAIAIYHRYLAASSVRFGVVDVAEVYHLKEKQLLSMVIKPDTTDADKQRASAAALEFAKALPVALAQLPEECKCLVLVRSAVAGDTPRTMDLTPLLKSKVGV